MIKKPFLSDDDAASNKAEAKSKLNFEHLPSSDYEQQVQANLFADEKLFNDTYTEVFAEASYQKGNKRLNDIILT